MDIKWKYAPGSSAADEDPLVTGYLCEIHDGFMEFAEPKRVSEVAKCPTCGYPICRACANLWEPLPETEADARKYMESCGEHGLAYCGYCGDYSPYFMLRYLNLIGVPIPPEYQNYKDISRENVEFYVTATVAALPDSQEIVNKIVETWKKGGTGVIKYQHKTGEIWGWTDKYPDKWVLTILYPEER